MRVVLALLLLVAAGCATAPPPYVCAPALLEDGRQVLACMPAPLP